MKLSSAVLLFAIWSVCQLIVNGQSTIDECNTFSDPLSTTCQRDVDSDLLDHLERFQNSLKNHNRKSEQLYGQSQAEMKEQAHRAEQQHNESQQQLQQQQQQLQQLQTQIQQLETKLVLQSNKSKEEGELLKLLKSEHQPLPFIRLLQARCTPLLIQQHFDGSNFFNRSWAEFRAGFGSTTGNYWIGNELLHQLTKDNGYKLRFDLQSLDDSQWYWAEYSTFIIGDESTGYQLQVGGFNGTVYRDALIWHNGRMFTASDRDNDERTDANCAVLYGGFWYSGCGGCIVNARQAFHGWGFTWSTLTDVDKFLKTSRMSIMCR